MSECNRVMVTGYSGAGKDTACHYLAEVTTLRFAGTTSDCLARHVAARLGISVQQARQPEALATRSADRTPACSSASGSPTTASGETQRSLSARRTAISSCPTTAPWRNCRGVCCGWHASRGCR
jgi:hypothetical protein